MRFIVIADSHIRFPDDDVSTYPSNTLLLDRNRRVVEMCNQIPAEFVVHLGDIVHPLPVEDAHVPAVELAASVYADLDTPIHFVAGNHDVGDKPDAMVAVPAVADENYPVFERQWGPAYKSFDYGDCHCVFLDAQVFNSKLAREAAQRTWLEEDLTLAAERRHRIFIFMHYPLYVRAPDEDEHYDNIGEPARTLLLNLIERHEVEAVFAGHVHNFLYNRYGSTDLYVLPATGFVRPDYSELAAVAPEREAGRDDPAKLGFFVVDVTPQGHTVRPIRTHGVAELGTPLPESTVDTLAANWRCPVGATMRSSWMSSTDFPTDGLDEFRRKTVRNDGPLAALWEARIDRIRFPVGDVADVSGAERLRHLHHRGMRFSLRSAGIPDARTLARVQVVGPLLDRWELAVWPQQYEAALQAVATAASAVPLAVAPVVPIGGGGVHHFVKAGFLATDQVAVEELLRADTDVIDEVVFRIPAGSDVDGALEIIGTLVADHGRSAVAVAELPRAGESEYSADDGALADWVEQVATAATAHPTIPVFLDGFVDHDRGYYRHIGLIDRRYNPRDAFYRLVAASAAVAVEVPG